MILFWRTNTHAHTHSIHIHTQKMICSAIWAKGPHNDKLCWSCLSTPNSSIVWTSKNEVSVVLYADPKKIVAERWEPPKQARSSLKTTHPVVVTATYRLQQGAEKQIHQLLHCMKTLHAWRPLQLSDEQWVNHFMMRLSRQNSHLLACLAKSWVAMSVVFKKLWCRCTLISASQCV
jgi:hypothetical protein